MEWRCWSSRLAHPVQRAEKKPTIDRECCGPSGPHARSDAAPEARCRSWGLVRVSPSARQYRYGLPDHAGKSQGRYPGQAETCPPRSLRTLHRLNRPVSNQDSRGCSCGPKEDCRFRSRRRIQEDWSSQEEYPLLSSGAQRWSHRSRACVL